MKKRLYFVLLVFMLASLIGCSSLGVATSGANYFNGKKEAELVKYFKYDGENIKTPSGDYDKVLRFSNVVTTVYVDKTTIQKFKNRRYNTISNFSFYKLYDGCYIYPQTQHYPQHVHSTEHIGGTVITKDYETAHNNNNTEINAKIESFNSAIQQYRAVKKYDDNAMFERTSINGVYYIYDIQTNRFAYSDNEGSGAVEYKYSLQAVTVYEDSKSSTETHAVYIYNDRENIFTDEKGNKLTESKALSIEKEYIEKGFETHKKVKGISLIAYIKDGIVAKVESEE